MIKIISYQGNANQDHSKIPSCTHQHRYYKKQKKHPTNNNKPKKQASQQKTQKVTSVRENVKKVESSNSAGRDERDAAAVENSLAIPQSVKHSHTREMKTHVHVRTCRPMLQQHYS